MVAALRHVSKILDGVKNLAPQLQGLSQNSLFNRLAVTDAQNPPPTDLGSTIGVDPPLPLQPGLLSMV
jgi:hypothetical protein